MNWACHSPPDIGGVDATSRRSREASFNGADGGVRNGTSSKNAFRNTASIPTTPSAPLRWLRIFFLMAQPPLLYQEGNCQPDSHSRLHRPRVRSPLPFRFKHQVERRLSCAAELSEPSGRDDLIEP